MKIHFYKYQATGNDFVLVDNRTLKHQFSPSQIATICDRRFGIGADGLILIENDPSADFKIIYYNGDATQSLCGNGCRSAIDLASRLGLVRNGQTHFAAYDGEHEGTLLPNDLIKLRMSDVKEIQVTPQMIEAGILALVHAGFGEAGEDISLRREAVQAIYLAMRANAPDARCLGG